MVFLWEIWNSCFNFEDLISVKGHANVWEKRKDEMKVCYFLLFLWPNTWEKRNLKEQPCILAHWGDRIHTGAIWWLIAPWLWQLLVTWHQAGSREKGGLGQGLDHHPVTYSLTLSPNSHRIHILPKQNRQLGTKSSNTSVHARNFTCKSQQQGEWYVSCGQRPLS